MSDATATRQIHVLIVEDVDEMRALMQRLIAEVPGIEVSGLARNTWEARLELARRKPDIALLDECLPGESSRDLLHEFKEQGVLVLLVTGMEEATHEVPSLAAGRIPKPSWESLDIDRERFRQAIHSLIRRSAP